MRRAAFLIGPILWLCMAACSGATKGPPAPSYAGDADKDGVKDADEQASCLNQIEDFDGFQDQDGCPEPDNDGDGIADLNDRCPGVHNKGDPTGCPGIKETRDLAISMSGDLDKDKDRLLDMEDGCVNDPEDYDKFQDNDGCPEPDNDGDTYLDLQDACPDQAEDGKGNKKTDGCPATDSDKDGVIDDEDQCPSKAGSPTATGPNKGCPDQDKDGIRDDLDKCPKANDPSGDGDGCPGTDFDGDKVPNNKDNCPDVAEDIDFIDDKDGCPEP